MWIINHLISIIVPSFSHRFPIFFLYFRIICFYCFPHFSNFLYHLSFIFPTSISFILSLSISELFNSSLSEFNKWQVRSLSSWYSLKQGRLQSEVEQPPQWNLVILRTFVGLGVVPLQYSHQCLFGPSIILLLLSFIFLFFPLLFLGGAAGSLGSTLGVDCSVVGAIEAVADGITGSIFSSKLELEEALSFGKSSIMSVSDANPCIHKKFGSSYRSKSMFNVSLLEFLNHFDFFSGCLHYRCQLLERDGRGRRGGELCRHPFLRLQPPLPGQCAQGTNVQ